MTLAVLHNKTTGAAVCIEIPHVSRNSDGFNDDSCGVPKVIRIRSSDNRTEIYRRRKGWRTEDVHLHYDLDGHALEFASWECPDYTEPEDDYGG